MRSLTLRLPDAMVAEIESEARTKSISKSEVVRRRLERASTSPTVFDLAADLIGSVDDDRLPADLSSRKKHYLQSRAYGKRGHR